MAYLTAGRRQAWPRRIAAKTPYHEQNAPRTMDANTGLKGNGRQPARASKKAPAPARTHIPQATGISPDTSHPSAARNGRRYSEATTDGDFHGMGAITGYGSGAADRNKRTNDAGNTGCSGGGGTRAEAVGRLEANGAGEIGRGTILLRMRGRGIHHRRGAVSSLPGPGESPSAGVTAIGHRRRNSCAITTRRSHAARQPV